MNYKIEGKGKDGDWSSDYADGGNVLSFATKQQADAAVDDLVATLGWNRDNLRVVISRTNVLDHYTVSACAVTGEWIGEPVASGETVIESEWNAQMDTEEESFETYEAEVFDDDENGMPVPHLETRALTRRWVFSEDQQLWRKIEDARQRVGAWKARREGSIDDPIAATVYALDDRYPGGWNLETFKACLKMIEEGVDPALAADEA